MALVDAVDRGDGGGDGDGDAEEQTERRASGVVRHEENDEDAATQASPSASPSPRRIIIAAASSETRPSNSSATARVYTVVMVVKTIGSLVGAPLMTAVWVAGIGVGGAGLGLPFWGSAVSVFCFYPCYYYCCFWKFSSGVWLVFPRALFLVVLFCFAWFAGLLLIDGGVVVEVEEMTG
ncbi:uncharacterized protein IWZ02DRAFT_294279 [Phyllosticta citriasiana]|uniref:uncharacterized protein n=1 Tax=Phyllosticta citriasiana TaxID=595635 RepID=UPI0030FDE161